MNPKDGNDAIDVVIVNNFGGPTLGGGEVQLLTLLRGLAGSEIGITLVCSAGSALETEASSIDGVRIVGVEFGGTPRALARAIESSIPRADVVQGTGFLTNVVARHLGRMLDARVINTVHVVPGASKLDRESSPRRAVRRVLDRSTRSQVDRYVAVSTAVADAAVAEGVERDRVTVIRNGLDLERIGVAAGSRSAEAARHRRVGYLGRLEAVKGCEYFVRAAAMLSARYPDVEFAVAGEGSQRAELERLAAGLDGGTAVQFLGYVANGPAFLAGLDVLVVPSLSEGSGLSAIEAMALGVPVVATEVGGLPEAVADGVTGLLVPPADTEALVSAISRLLDEPAMAKSLGESGVRRAEQLFSAERMTGEYLELYRTLAD